VVHIVVGMGYPKCTIMAVLYLRNSIDGKLPKCSLQSLDTSFCSCCYWQLTDVMQDAVREPAYLWTSPLHSRVLWWRMWLVSFGAWILLVGWQKWYLVRNSLCHLSPTPNALFQSMEWRMKWSMEYEVEEQVEEEKWGSDGWPRFIWKVDVQTDGVLAPGDVAVVTAWQQHDVQELCRVMFDALERSWKYTDQANLITQLYQGKIKDYVKCLQVSVIGCCLSSYTLCSKPSILCFFTTVYLSAVWLLCLSYSRITQTVADCFHQIFETSTSLPWNWSD